MLDMKIADARKLFIDTRKIRRPVDRAKMKVPTRSLARIRLSARQSMKVKQGSAPPGKPPHAHTRLLKDNVFYVWDRRRDAGVVGPVKLNKPSEAPAILERGGRVVTRYALKRAGGRNTRGQFQKDLVESGKKRTVRIAKRPYMGPALIKESPNIAKHWRGSVRA